jgi:hypothetical protein
MVSVPPMRIEFRFGEVLPADDPLARWVVKLAMIHNDLVFANRNLLAADDQTIEWFYWYRYAIAHYHEAMNTLAEEHEIAEVAAFVGALSQETRALHDAALEIHAEVEAASSRIRNETTFHYPSAQTRRVLTTVLEELADEAGSVESESGKVRDSRAVFADEVVARLFYRAIGGDDDAERITARLAEGEKNLMQFINHALDEFFAQRVQLDANS